MENKNIVSIDINNLYHHPDNRSYDKCGLYELAESIRENGVLQNLVVIPYDREIHHMEVPDPANAYVVVIGNRRLDAAKMAGLAEVPCVIAHMTAAEQISTKLVENILRKNMTPREEAQAMQMMLDLGETVDTVAKKTGFSRMTVRNRLFLLTLDQEKLESADMRGGTLSDYLAIKEIKNPEQRDKLMDAIGTNDFRNLREKFLTQQKKDEDLAEVIALVKSYGKDLTEKPEDENVKSCFSYWAGCNRPEAHSVPADTVTVKYYYKIETIGYPCVRVYRSLLPDEAAAADAETREKEDALFDSMETQLEEATLRAFKLRVDFVKGLSPTALKKHPGTVASFVKESLNYLHKNPYDHSTDNALMAEILGITYDAATDNVVAEEFVNQATACIDKVLFTLAYCTMESNRRRYWNLAYEKGKWIGFRHLPNSQLDTLYDTLAALGYEISTEEAALRDGTHELILQEA